MIFANIGAFADRARSSGLSWAHGGPRNLDMLDDALM